uniref:Uncharacterized protein n=1 Tax=Glossina brevipalpis TaxID=37001 RepID=A0A1A9WUN0_9MUSC
MMPGRVYMYFSVFVSHLLIAYFRSSSDVLELVSDQATKFVCIKTFYDLIGSLESDNPSIEVFSDNCTLVEYIFELQRREELFYSCEQSKTFGEERASERNISILCTFGKTDCTRGVTATIYFLISFELISSNHSADALLRDQTMSRLFSFITSCSVDIYWSQDEGDPCAMQNIVFRRHKPPFSGKGYQHYPKKIAKSCQLIHFICKLIHNFLIWIRSQKLCIFFLDNTYFSIAPLLTSLPICLFAFGFGSRDDSDKPENSEYTFLAYV